MVALFALLILVCYGKFIAAGLAVLSVLYGLYLLN